jgi:hypothetical protein
MYSIDEAEQELAEKEQVKPSKQVVDSLPSFRQVKKKEKRGASFFQKLFSNSKMNRVHNEYVGFPDSEVPKEDQPPDDVDKLTAGEKKIAKIDENQQRALAMGEIDEIEESSESFEAIERIEDNEEDFNEDEEKEDHDDNHDDYRGKSRYSRDYPAMPVIGKAVKIDLLVNRTNAANDGVKYLLAMAADDVQESINKAKQIPVHFDIDRAAVTKDISNAMAKVRSARGINHSIDSRINEIQKSLNYRKSGLIMMNFNYSNKVVKKIEPIYINEARSIVVMK